MAKIEPYERLANDVASLLRLTAVQAVKGMKTGEAIRLLGSAGLDRDVIASICGTSRNAVNARLSEAKRQKNDLSEDD